MNPPEYNLLQESTAIAFDVHRKQLRKSEPQLPFLVHPMAVLRRMYAWNISEINLLAAAILHDTIEDSDMPILTANTIREHLNQNIYDYVMEVTIPPDVDKAIYLEGFNEKSAGALLLKVADRLCNVEDFIISDSKYAYKYFRKADALFKTFYKREKECKKSYSRAWERGLRDINTIIKKLDVTPMYWALLLKDKLK